METSNKETRVKLIKCDDTETDGGTATVNGDTPFHRYVRDRNSSYRKKTNRIVFKSGHFNLGKKIKFKYRVFPDIVTAFIGARWRWTIVYSILTYVSIWLFFAFVWWSILYEHGDLAEEHLPDKLNSSEWTPCVTKIYDFTSIFLFSIEIHTTIGYGARTITLQCPSAWLTMCIESIIGTMTQSFVVCIVFAKLTRPKNRAQTLIFSKNAIINQRDDSLCVTFRVGNTRKSRIVDVSLHAYLLRCVKSGRILNDQIKLHLSVDSCKDVSFMLPISAVHKIDESSPFYILSAHDILNSKLEILVVFEGIIESTGQPVQARSSYTAKEILWGHRFASLVEYQKEKQGFVIDYSKFNETLRINTPLCSSLQLYDNHKENFDYGYIPAIGYN